MIHENEATLDPGAWLRQRIAHTPQEMAWETRTGSTEDWQSTFRTRLEDVIGLSRLKVSSGSGVGNVRSIEVRQLDGYRRETMRFETQPGLDAFGYLLIPDGVNEARPAIVCLPGHGRGVDSLVGIAEDGSQRPLEAPDEYQADFALQCVARGYVTFALEQISFGHRRDSRAVAQGPGASSCHDDSMAALMFGESMTGWRVWDACRTVDLLENRSEVAAGRVAVMGISGGGLTALFAAAVDTRIKAAVVSGYLNSFAASVLSVHHCVDNYAPDLYRLCEMADVAGLITPRALYAENGIRDHIFPVEAFERAAVKVGAIYASVGATDPFLPVTFDGDHRFHGRDAWDFLARCL